MTNKYIMFAIVAIATASIAILPAFAANIGAQLTVSNGFTHTPMYSEACGTGMCFAYIYTDTDSGIGEFIWGTSGNQCDVDATLIRNGTSTLIVDDGGGQGIKTKTILNMEVGELIQLASIYTGCN